LPNEFNAPVIPWMVSRSVFRKLSAATFPAGSLDGVGAELDAEFGWLEGELSAPWLWPPPGDPPVSVSATAIPPPALPMRRPVESRQAPAAKRKCVEIRISSHQQGTHRWYSSLILAHAVYRLPRFCGETPGKIIRSKPLHPTAGVLAA
jgi:hypothetical protein